MNALTVISTDLLTPLGAYLRLREGGGASFLLESVERGRLGRHSFVGCGSRLCSFEEAERAREPLVGYLAYDYVAQLEPTVPLPAEGSALPDSMFVIPDVLVRFDHVRGIAEVLHGNAPGLGTVPTEGLSLNAPVPRHERTRRSPDARTYEEQ